MDSFDEFLASTEAKRVGCFAELSKQIADVASAENPTMATLLGALLDCATDRSEEMLRMYHDWLTAQLSQDPQSR